ncbi:hypothetical protein F3J38_26280 [Pantoea sp. Acro-805]|uniref:Uncharacterized protein n=1 Tax=Candidatus Pantoea formicae TaxID=2608355 RepID=A0ABX0R2R6_9GAMM|nr:hypothetical protein [Pantoea formicae]NIF03513.1 hypothetical protein [Pantoea formicae]
MTHTGMFVFVLIALAWSWLMYLGNSNHQRRLQAQEEERKRNQPLRLRDMENAEQEYYALLKRLNVTDRWFRHAWPLAQISLMWCGPPGSLTSSIPAALRAASGELLMHGAGNFSCGCLADAGIAPGLMWHIASRITETEPSVFMDEYGSKTRPGAWRRGFKYVLMPDSQVRVAILLQGTRHATAEMLSLYLSEVADRLERGDADGAAHADDSGWAFRTFPAESSAGDTANG